MKLSIDCVKDILAAVENKAFGETFTISSLAKGKSQSDDFLKKYENEIDTLWDKKYIKRSIIDYSSTWEPIFSKCKITDDGKAYLESEKRSRICFLIPVIISILGVLISFFR